jgi:hypothetical protein
MPNFVKISQPLHEVTGNTRTYLMSLRKESSLKEEKGRKEEDRMKDGREEA